MFLRNIERLEHFNIEFHFTTFAYRVEFLFSSSCDQQYGIQYFPYIISIFISIFLFLMMFIAISILRCIEKKIFYCNYFLYDKKSKTNILEEKITKFIKLPN